MLMAMTPPADQLARILENAFAPLHKRALGVASGLTAGFAVFLITAFHLVEHLEPDVQIELLEVALQALKPGGLLVLETPNPTNLVVGASSFYTDPTHLRPVNPGYLAFLCSDVGFVGVETRFLHPRDGYSSSDSEVPDLRDELMWALRGPQDFAVLGRKPADTVDRPS